MDADRQVFPAGTDEFYFVRCNGADHVNQESGLIHECNSTNSTGTPPSVKLLIDGQPVESSTKEWREVVNPATQEVLAKVPFATAEEIDRAIRSAHAAFDKWKRTSVGTRMRIMLRYQALVREHLPRIAKTLSAEQGKTLADAEGDIFRGLEVVEHACSIGSLAQGEFLENVAGGVDTYTLRQPIGVCAGITPFNFPAMIPLWMFPAIRSY
jgi:malonate-semialdehyde dehydrogenase (acetylating)/methylmalonate-semialdehyde dehydrogenase